MSPSRGRWLWLVFVALLTALLAGLFVRHVLGAPPGAFSWTWGGEAYELLEPRAFAVLLAVPVLLLLVRGSLADLPWQQRVLGLLFRTAFFALIALALAQLVRTARDDKVCTVYLVDVSDSVPDAALAGARAHIEAAREQKRPDDQVRLVTFARRPRLVELSADGVADAAALRHAPVNDADRPGAGTNLQAALQLAFGLFPPGYLRRAVLLTDGVETDGDVLSEANRAAGFGVKLFAVPYREPPPAEVAVRTLQIPDKVEIGAPFAVTAEVYASRKTTARARLYQGEMLNGLGGVRTLELEPGVNEVRFDSVVRVGGDVTYALELDRIEEDTFPDNNRFAATLKVPGRPTVLYVEGQPERARYLATALGAQQFDVDVRSASAFPGSLKELERYDFFVLSDVPAEQVSVSSQDLVERYVRDLGGGFLFAGGAAGFGLGGWAHTTMERILPVRMDVERQKDQPGVAMALVIDRSGSMTGLPMEMAKAACKATVGTLQGDDLIEIIAFDSAPNRYVKMQPARYRARIINEIARIQPGGGTEIFSALDMAYQDLSVTQARKKHVVLLTDGKAETQGIRDLVQAMIAENITVTTVGLGDGADDELLRMVADTGGGRYHRVPDPNSLPRIFTRETEMISRQAAVEDWFPVVQTGNADFLKGVAIGGAPLLHGYVATQMKPSPAQQILASDRGEPILARVRLGTGWTLAWTSDVKNLWASDWLRWRGFSQFWGQLVREHMRQRHRREMPMRTEMIGGRVHAVVDAFTGAERFDNGMRSKLAIVGPQPGGERREVPFRQTAPGRYEADFDLDAYGSFLLQAEHLREADDGTLQPVGVSYGKVSHPYPREYAAFEPDIERLERAVAIAGGVLDPAVGSVFDPGGEEITYREALWSRFVLWAILAFLLDLLVRRVRIFDRGFRGVRGARRLPGAS
jgi:Ca-activated chloride channel homolog